jgi:acyl-CoA reductase-like NAD-dependent aldehyde dehydrogenase
MVVSVNAALGLTRANWVDGEWRPAARSAWTRMLVGGEEESWPQSDLADVTAANGAAARASVRWSSFASAERHACAVALTEALESNSDLAPRLAARFGLTPADCAPHLRGLVDEARAALARTPDARPGVAWHAPDWRELLRASGLELALELAAGRAVVLVADPRMPELAEVLARAAESAGVPAGVVNLLHGARRELLASGLGVAARLSASGSVEFMAELRRVEGTFEARLRALRAGTLEVDREHALEERVEDVVTRAFGASATFGGQLPGSLARVFCPAKSFSSFTELLLERLAGFGALVPRIDAEAATHARAAFELGLDEGATCIAGGDGEGLLFPATVFTNVEPYMESAKRQEPLPVLCLLRGE